MLPPCPLIYQISQPQNIHYTSFHPNFTFNSPFTQLLWVSGSNLMVYSIFSYTLVWDHGKTSGKHSGNEQYIAIHTDIGENFYFDVI